MKICYLTRSQDFRIGGLDRYSFEVISRTAKKPGVEVVALVEQASGQPNEQAILKSVAGNFWLLFYNAFRVRRFIKTCDVIHALDLYPYGLIAAMASLGLNKTLFINGVGTDSVARLDRLVIGQLLLWAYRRAKKVLCISQYTKNRILEKAPGLKNLEVVYLGVDTRKFLRQDFAKSPDDPVIIGVGALKRRKGYHVTIPAVAKIISKYPELKYYIVGSQSIGKYTEQLKILVASHGLEKNVMFLENISDEQLLNLYYLSDIFVLTSVNIGDHFEGFGLVFLEAGLCGLPSVGTLNNAIEEAVKVGETGILVEQENIEQTAEALDRLLSDSVLRRRMGEAARKRASDLDWDRTVEKYLTHYGQGG